MSKALFIIDPQKDFIDDPDFHGALEVPGSYEDMKRLAQHIIMETPECIKVTMDTHSRMHIANQIWWVNEKGENPPIFTLISVADVESGKWKASVSEKQEHSLNYVRELAVAGKYMLCIWPDHCIDGTEGHKVTEVIKEALDAWEIKTGNKVEYIFKGKNPDTEMYSGLKAEVVMSEDPETEINKELIEKLRKFDEVEVAGQAKSHCVEGTINDLIDNFGDDASKITVLENCMSNVPGFEANGDKLIARAKEAGCTIKNVAFISKKLKM